MNWLLFFVNFISLSLGAVLLAGIWHFAVSSKSKVRDEEIQWLLSSNNDDVGSNYSYEQDDEQNSFLVIQIGQLLPDSHELIQMHNLKSAETIQIDSESLFDESDSLPEIRMGHDHLTNEFAFNKYSFYGISQPNSFTPSWNPFHFQFQSMADSESGDDDEISISIRQGIDLSSSRRSLLSYLDYNVGANNLLEFSDGQSSISSISID